MIKKQLNAFLNEYMKFRAVCSNELAREYFEKNICPEEKSSQEISFFYNTGRVARVRKRGPSLYGFIKAKVDVYQGPRYYTSEEMDLVFVVLVKKRCFVDYFVELYW